MLINPEHGYIIELFAGEKEILNFDDAQNRLKNEGNGFFWLGIFCVAGSAFLATYAVADLIKKKKRKKKRKGRKSAADSKGTR